MPRIPRGQVAGHVYHVLNRGNGGATVFHKDGDCTAYLDLLAMAKAKYPVKLFGVCLMPNHFHLVVQPATDAALSPFMQWWMTRHVRRYHRHYHSHGHVWQGRFKSFPIQQDGHLLTSSTMCSAIRSAQGWSSTRETGPGRVCESRICATPLPIEAPTEWLPWIEQPIFDHELTTLRTCVNRQQPFGTTDWQVTALGLESTLRQRGRPRKFPEK